MRWVGSIILSLLLFYAIPSVGQSQNDVGYKIVSIYFRGGSYFVDDTQKERVREFLSKEILSNYEIHIHSHTDNVGGVEFNEWLSKMRSEATYFFLITDGIPERQVFIKDHGLFNPDFDNQTNDGRARNRRVDVVLWPLPM